MKIGHKLVLSSLAFSSLACVVGLYATSVSRRAMRTVIEHTSAEMAAELVADVDQEVHDRLHEWQRFATAAIARETLVASNSEFQALDDMQSHLASRDRHWRTTDDPSDSPLMSGVLSHDLSRELRRRIASSHEQERYSVYGEVFLTNRYGANVAMTSRTSDYRQDDEVWWQEAMRTGSHVGEVAIDDSTNTLTLPICIRIDDAAGVPLGAIKAVLNFDAITTLLQDDQPGHTYTKSPVHAGVKGEQRLKHRVLLLTNDRRVLFDSQSPEKSSVGAELYPHVPFDLQGEQTSMFRRDDARHGQILGISASAKGHDDYAGKDWILVIESRERAVMAPVRALRNQILIISLAIAVGVFILATLFSVSLSRRIQRLRRVALDVGCGRLTLKERKWGHDELGDLGRAIHQVAENQRQVAHQANIVAEGDYSKDIAVRSDEDELAASINRMAASLRNVVRQANAIAQGDYETEITPLSEKDELGVALKTMTENLRHVSTQNERDRWLKTGQAELSDVMRGEQDLPTLSKNVITYLAKYIDARLGVLYSHDESKLRLTGSYAFTRRKRLSETIEIGEGLVGQAALEGESISITEVPEDYVTVNSGLGESVPRNLLAAPIMHDGQLKGVLELGTLRQFDKSTLEFIELVSENIGIAITSAQDREKMTDLLGRSRRQATELQSQQEELRAANEEMEEQTQALRQSEEKLKIQSEELQATNEELEEKSEHLTRQKNDIERKNGQLELATRQVEEKARDLEASSKYKSEFLANMSHELRTPLNSLLILAKSLASNDEGNLTEDQVESANVIHEGGKDLLHLINEILDLSKVEAGKLDTHVEDIAITSISGRLRSQFTPLADEKGLRFQVEIDDDLPRTITTDGQRVEQILRNLLSNAFKFTSQGEVTMRFRRPERRQTFHRAELGSSEVVMISVTDTGIGIPDDRKQAIFEAFRQVDGSTSRKYGGTGLGLSISRELAKLLGGEIQLESSRGQGSTFSLCLPLVFSDADSDHDSSRSRYPTSSTTPDSRNRVASRAAILPEESLTPFLETCGQTDKKDRTVLVIEDDPRFSKILADLIRKRGHQCLTASDGRSGLLAAMESSPTGIILDLGLPDIDGLSVLTQLKENLGTRHIPVHVISGRDEGNSSMLHGAVGHLAKPANTEDIQRALGKIEDASRQRVKEVLVVEDNEALRNSLAKLVENEGITTSGVGTGEAALGQIATGRFDCVVLDLGLPDMTGFELLEKLEELVLEAMPPVIVYTGRSLSREEHARLSKYAGSIVLKDVNSEQRVLDEALLFLHSVEASLPDSQRSVVRMLHDPDQSLRDRTVLLVDDDMRNTYALSKMLQESGLNVIMADNGELALEKLEGEPEIDLVVMDIMMPVMDGYETMLAIRQDPRHQDLPIIAITAKAMPEDRAKCLEAGADDYMTKPVDTERLISLMRVWLFEREPAGA